MSSIVNVFAYKTPRHEAGILTAVARRPSVCIIGMPDAVYTIHAEPNKRLIRLVLSGFWNADEAKAFVRDQQAAVKSLGLPYGNHFTLADVRDFAVQTQEVTAAIRNLVMHATFISKRIALVGGDGLARIQVTRITQRQDVRRFDSIEEVEAWLLS